jgi:hypothetical protein
MILSGCAGRYGVQIKIRTAATMIIKTLRPLVFIPILLQIQKPRFRVTTNSPMKPRQAEDRHPET